MGPVELAPRVQLASLAGQQLLPNRAGWMGATANRHEGDGIYKAKLYHRSSTNCRRVSGGTAGHRFGDEESFFGTRIVRQGRH